MKHTKWLLFVVAILALGAIATGCSQPASETTGEPAAVEEETATTAPVEEETEEPAAGPAITITEPAEGAEVEGPDVDVAVTVEGVEIVNKLNQPNVEGEGHLHWIVDGAAPVPSPETTFQAKGLKAGEHEVKVEIHQNSHEPFDPPAEATVKFMVK